MCKYCKKYKDEGYYYCPHCGRQLVIQKDSIPFGEFIFCLLAYPFLGIRVLLAKLFASKDSDFYKYAHGSFGIIRRILRRSFGLPL